MKKPNCRKSNIEKEQHNRAVRIRKMTDQQLCEYVDGLSQPSGMGVKEFLKEVENLPGIGKVTLKKLKEAAEHLKCV